MRDPSKERPKRIGSRGSAALALDFVLFPAVLAAVLVVLFCLPIGILAAVTQDGLNETMRSGLGFSAPLPQRVFRGVQQLARFWPLVVAVALIHVALRQLFRRRSAFGDSVSWDGLVSPLLTTAILGSIGAVWVLVRGRSHALDDIVGWGVPIGASALVVLAIAGLVLALGRRRRGLRMAVAMALVAAVGIRLGAEAWGRAALRNYRAREVPERTALDARRAARERPVLRGPAIDEDAWPRYQKLIDDLGAYLDANPAARSSLGDPEPLAPIPAAAKAVLEIRRGDVLALREATRCRRCLPVLITNPVGTVPSLLAARHLASLVALEGNERAQAGDPAGAADRYLDLVRFGGDLGGGNLIHALVGSGVEQSGLRALVRLVRSGRLETALLDRIERERGLLERDRASLAEALGNERRMLDGLGDALDTWSSSLGEPLILPALVPYRALAAHAQHVADPLYRGFQSALARDDFETWRQLGIRSDSVAGSSWNPLLRFVMGYGVFDDSGTHSTHLFLSARRSLAQFRLVEAALSLERDKRIRGRYPSDETQLALPKDPFAPLLPLKYRPEGSSYRLWSIGTDGIDDGGKAEKEADIVLQ